MQEPLLHYLDLIATSPRINEQLIYDFYSELLQAVTEYEYG